ncbi:MAG: hypothetical protein RL213_1498 [Bacteroidota bacterium]|jgi:hypothetical protein
MYSVPGNRLLFLLFLSLAAYRSDAQTTTSSPYTRFGIGDVQGDGIMQTLGMGGTGIAATSGLSVNFCNPAAYGRLQSTLFESGFKGDFVRLKDGTADRMNNSVSFGYLALAFPVKSGKAGFGFGILPYSSVGYSLKDSDFPSTVEGETHTYAGSGGLHRLFLSAGATLAKNLTAGFASSVIFGQIIQDRRVEFSDPNYLNTRLTDTRSNQGFKFDFGLQYTFDSLRISPSDSVMDYRRKHESLRDSLRQIDKSGALGLEVKAEIKRLRHAESAVAGRRQRGGWNLTAGLVFQPSMSIRSERSLLSETFRYLDASTREQVVVKDTTYYSTGEKSSLKLPMGVGFGLSMRQGNRWLVGTDLRLQNWSEYRSFGESDSLADSWRLSAGMQFLPDERGFKSGLKKLQYMAGLHYSRTFLQLNGSQLNETGLSLGIGLPVRRSLSTIRFMGEVGKRGTVDSGLLEENYFRFTINFTLNDKWFIKHRYD